MICPVAILPIVPVTAPMKTMPSVLPITMRVGMFKMYIMTGM